ncbi:hypothetical protein LPJ75_004372, partial [Coemansia sp. RSA 2598]
MTSVNQMTWTSPLIEPLKHPSTQCAIYSGLYAANLDNMFCTTSNLPALFGAQCSIPYSLSYGYTDNMIAPAAIYSHTIYFGNNLCDDSGKKRIHFYTMLQNYIAFAESITGYQLYVMPDHHDRGYNMDPKFKMNEPLFGPIDGAKIYAKNLFIQVNSEEIIEPEDPSSGNTNNNSNNNSGSNNNNSGSNSSGNSSGGSSNNNSGSSNGSSNNSGSGSNSDSDRDDSNQNSGNSANPTATTNGSNNNGNNDSSNNDNSDDHISFIDDITDANSDGFADDIFVAEGETFSETGLHTLTQTISGRPTVMVVTATRVAITGVRQTSGPDGAGTKNAASS